MGGMNVTFSDKLVEYLARKGYHNLRVSLADTAVESGYAEALVEPVTERQVQDLLTEKYRYVYTIPGGEAIGGEVYVTSRGLEFDPDVHFDLKSFLGIKHVVATGIHAFRFR